MCEVDPAAHGAPKFPVVRLFVLGVVVAASVVIIIVAPNKHARGTSQPSPLSQTDRVFARDLAATAREALAVAGRSDSALALSERAAQRTWLARLAAIDPARQRRIVPAREPGTLRVISQQQLLLARIELASGHDPALLTLAREVRRGESAHLRSTPVA